MAEPRKLPPGWEWDTDHEVYRYREVVRLASGEKVRVRASGRTMAEARAEFERKEKEANERAARPSEGGPTGSKLFSTFAAEWLATYPASVKNRTNTRIEKEYHVNKRILPYFDRLGKERGRPFTLSDLNQKIVDKFIADLNDSDHMRRDAKTYVYKGQVRTLSEWAVETGIGRETLAKRIYKGWDIERAVTTPAIMRTHPGAAPEPAPACAPTRKLSAKAVHNIAQTFRKMLTSAKRWEEISSVPEVPHVKLAKSKFDFLDFAETDRLLSVIKDPEDRALFLAAVKSGPRPGELLAYQWTTLDFATRSIRIEQQIDRHTSELADVKAGERTVPMSPALHDALKAIKHLRGPLVFCDESGRPRTREWLTKRLAKYLRRAGLRRLSPHKLRHTYASHLAMLGFTLPEIQKWMGHTSITMTMKYAHLMPKHGWERISLLDSPPKAATEER